MTPINEAAALAERGIPIPPGRVLVVGHLEGGISGEGQLADDEVLAGVAELFHRRLRLQRTAGTLCKPARGPVSVEAASPYATRGGALPLDDVEVVVGQLQVLTDGGERCAATER
jgi:hypothetical protein